MIPPRRRAAPALGLTLILAACSGHSPESTRSPVNPPTADAQPTKRAKSPRPLTFAEAERAHHEALAVDARDRGAFEGLARLYYDRGIAGEPGYLLLAGRVIDQGARALAEVGQASAELAWTRALLELARDRPDRAHEALLAALRADPSHARAALAIAGLELRFHDPAAALAHLEVAAGEPALALEVRLGQGVAHFAADDLDAADRAFAAARRLAPADPRPHFNLGLVAVRRVLEDEALLRTTGEAARRSLDRYLEIVGDDPGEAARIDQARGLIAALEAIREVVFAPICQPPPSRAEREAEAAERRRLLGLERAAAEAMEREAEAAARQRPHAAERRAHEADAGR